MHCELKNEVYNQETNQNQLQHYDKNNKRILYDI